MLMIINKLLLEAWVYADLSRLFVCLFAALFACLINIFIHQSDSKKRKKYKQVNSTKNTLNSHYIRSQNTTVLAKFIDQICVFNNKFLTSFFDS